MHVKNVDLRGFTIGHKRGNIDVEERKLLLTGYMIEQLLSFSTVCWLGGGLNRSKTTKHILIELLHLVFDI